MTIIDKPFTKLTTLKRKIFVRKCLFQTTYMYMRLSCLLFIYNATTWPFAVKYIHIIKYINNTKYMYIILFIYFVITIYILFNEIMININVFQQSRCTYQE